MDDEPRLVDPLEASRHPFETYLLALAAVSGVPLLFGQSNSSTIQHGLPPLVVAAWGAMLLIGSTTALAGLYWRGRASTALLMERAGLHGVGGAALVYAVVLLVGTGWTGGFAACITGGFGVACFAQARRISARITTALHQMRADHG